ncbi:uncharacterized protein LOC129583567 [Paramacrobiotus metropolitanus]|uniref:uncharacterized protein LOC129583567 n=1 Tax=Paramacrobiotus metropolitanus TaxID=2943436 RepID=UPI002445CBD0|nr:uncharacterized protein LOC129583567 [Paramacrobiotus metropolitanus]
MAADESFAFPKVTKHKLFNFNRFPADQFLSSPNSEHLDITFPSNLGMGDSVNTLLQWVGADNSPNRIELPSRPFSTERSGSRFPFPKVQSSSNKPSRIRLVNKRRNISDDMAAEKMAVPPKSESKENPEVKSISLPPAKGFLAPNQLGTAWIPLAAFR